MKIIYIHSHDTGRYIEPYGYNVSTPNLMKLSKRTTLFGNAYSATPTCSPSRGALLTGMYPHLNGLIGLAHRGFSITNYENHLARFMKKYGYETVISGQHHEARWQEDIGYDKCLVSQKDAEAATFDKRAVEYLAAIRAAEYILENQDKENYFLAVGFFYPHEEWLPKDESIELNHVRVPKTMADTAQNREEYARYMTSVNYMDKCVGVVLDAIAAANIEDDLYLMYTTDHGVSLPDMKCTLYDEGIGVSLMIDFPGNKMRGERVDTLVSQVDVFPTICDIAGIPKPEGLSGTSMLPVFEGNTEAIHDYIVGETNYHADYVPGRCIRTEKYKYIKLWDGYVSETGQHGRRQYPPEALYDLTSDPCEKNNLIGNEQYKDVLYNMQQKLHQYMTETNDPLLAGKIDAPDNVKLGKHDWSEY